LIETVFGGNNEQTIRTPTGRQKPGQAKTEEKAQSATEAEKATACALGCYFGAGGKCLLTKCVE